MVIAVLFGALAQDAPEASAESDVAETVIVYSREEVDQAKDQIIQELKQLGYDKRMQKDGAVVMRHQDAWKGDVWLHDDGWMRIKRQPVRLEAPPGGVIGCVLLPFRCVRAGGQMVSKRKFEQVETRTAGSVMPSVSEWGDRVADFNVSNKVQGLPDRLTALWEEGTPLDGEELLASMPQRKDAVLTFWETRTNNPWGEAVRDTVEAFIRGEIQQSEHAYTSDEIAHFNRRSRAGRPLVLERRP